MERYKGVVLEELTELAEADFKPIKKRLRGRAGQKIIGLFNPVSEQHWIKKNIFDKETLVDVNTDMFGTLKSANTGEILPKEYSEIAGKQINSSRMVFNPRTGENEIHQPDMLIMRSTHLNNFWVVGSPDGSFGYYD
ncbi:hypothetical protein EZS27_036112 [termite gut metagenome]|uniref:Phage terminase large subunit N-terminal domain-containing protein n=1 Tax=termite gut metagenome TaxID=433724 RepID=A0A5J4PWP5_9ZZZZ